MYLANYGMLYFMTKKSNQVKAKKRRERRSVRDSMSSCGKFYRVLQCTKDAEHKLFKRIYCGFAGCPNCRKSDWDNHETSETVRRRVIKTWDKIMYAKNIDKFVLTFPKSIQEKFYIHEELNILFHEASEFAMAMTGIKGCIVSLHPVGNESEGFGPHFEVMVPYEDSEWQDPYGDKDYNVVQSLWLGELSKYWTQCLRSLYPEAMKKVKTNIQAHYGFHDKPGRMVHAVRYAADFHWAVDYDRWDNEKKNFLMMLSGTRTVRGFGFLSDRKWKKHVSERVPYWQFDAFDSYKDEFGDEIDEGSHCFVADCSGRMRAVRFQVGDKMVWSVPKDHRIFSQLMAIGQGIFCDIVQALKILKKRPCRDEFYEYIDELSELAGAA